MQTKINQFMLYLKQAEKFENSYKRDKNQNKTRIISIEMW